MKTSLFIFISSVLFMQSASADMSKMTVVSLNTIYIDRDYDVNGVKSQNKETDTDLRLTRIEKNWAYGAIYTLSSNDSSDSNRSAYGISGGYFSEKDFYMTAHYFISAKYHAAGVEYSGGSGYGVDIGFLSKITPSFYVGLLMAHRSFTYSQQSSPAGNTAVSVTQKELLPLFTFAVVFM